MKQLTLRFATADDKDALDWLSAVPEFDPAIITYPTLRTLVASNGSPVAYLPTQKALVMESLALKPDLDKLTAAQAMRDMVKGVELMASSEGIREIYFIGTSQSVIQTAKRNGFEELPWPVLRLKL